MTTIPTLYTEQQARRGEMPLPALLDLYTTIHHPQHGGAGLPTTPRDLVAALQTPRGDR